MATFEEEVDIDFEEFSCPTLLDVEGCGDFSVISSKVGVLLEDSVLTDLVPLQQFQEEFVFRQQLQGYWLSLMEESRCQRRHVYCRDKCPTVPGYPEELEKAVDGCLDKTYSKLFPTTFIVIVCYNKDWSKLLKTVWRVINRSPRPLLKKIILVDDASEREHFGRKLEEYAKKLSTVNAKPETARNKHMLTNDAIHDIEEPVVLEIYSTQV
ncbi:hypothetical protein ILUMI_20890 [Ignelater luminosus]|uniref:Glycosyltransferase 2-like domain-containing protein n=1 Tax=Ignelater luminosus TaxID=2038154 RepID=A0A8K0G1X3_IGNLU|nr:hypothetical protein ILUMI_20890 [Ignelater luminosus]